MSQFEVFKDNSNEYRWRLRANNFRIIATSGEGYINKSDCLHAIQLVKELAPTAQVIDKTSALSSLL